MKGNAPETIDEYNAMIPKTCFMGSRDRRKGHDCWSIVYGQLDPKKGCGLCEFSRDYESMRKEFNTERLKYLNYIDSLNLGIDVTIELKRFERILLGTTNELFYVLQSRDHHD